MGGDRGRDTGEAGVRDELDASRRRVELIRATTTVTWFVGFPALSRRAMLPPGGTMIVVDGRSVADSERSIAGRVFTGRCAIAGV